MPNALCKEPDSKRFWFCGPSLSQRLGPVTAASEPCMGLAALQQNLVDKNCQGAMWSPATPWSRVSFSEDMVGNAAGWSWGCQENMRRHGGGLRPASQARSQGGRRFPHSKGPGSYAGPAPEAASQPWYRIGSPLEPPGPAQAEEERAPSPRQGPWPVLKQPRLFAVPTRTPAQGTATCRTRPP